MAGGGTPRVALVLSGGGARGAYEAGVLSYFFEALPRRLGRAPHFDIVTGTSVGAVHACYVAGSGQDPAAAERLRSIWASLSLDAVYRLGMTDLVRLPLRFLGSILPASEPAEGALPDRMEGILDTSWLRALVMDRVHWHGIRRNFANGSLSALAVATTEVATGRTVVFVDRRGTAPLAPDADPHVTYCETRIGPRHALASAAIPLLFPTIRIADAFHCDGGLRLNTPLAPAIHLGADRVLVVGLRYQASPAELLARRRRREGNIMSPTYLAGKALNALLLDRVETDLERLRQFNAILDAADMAGCEKRFPATGKLQITLVFYATASPPGAGPDPFEVKLAGPLADTPLARCVGDGVTREARKAAFSPGRHSYVQKKLEFPLARSSPKSEG